MTTNFPFRTLRRTSFSVLCALLAFFPACPASAELCASDPVPAATLLFPFVTGRFAAGSTATNPIADRSSPTTLLSITNVSSTAKIVHLVLWNDLGAPLLSWDALLTGYDVYAVNFADVMEGYLRPTGPATNPATLRGYSPTGTQPTAWGPLPTFFFGGIPNLRSPGGVGTTSNNTASIFGLCTNPTYTTPFTVQPGSYAARIPEYLRAFVFDGLRKSQWISENGWWTLDTGLSTAPEWLRNFLTDDNVAAYLTADVVAACGAGTPADGADYFDRFAIPRTRSWYRNDPASRYAVGLGNVLIGDWFVIGPADEVGEGGRAVRVEVDNEDVENSPLHPRAIRRGASFYRYATPNCSGADDDPDFCAAPDPVATGGSIHRFGSARSAVSDRREPLPSAFAFRWRNGGANEARTKVRVWKEMSDVVPEEGGYRIDDSLPYSYWVWDDDERTYQQTCPFDGCPRWFEWNQFPLVTQEVDLSELFLPEDVVSSGWVLLAFPGSNGELLRVPGGYETPWPEALGEQAWVETVTILGDRVIGATPATPIGNFLCDGKPLGSGDPPRGGGGPLLPIEASIRSSRPGSGGK